MRRAPLVTYFDLDDTLYPAESGVWSAISSRIDAYLMEEIGLDSAAASASRSRYSDQFGTTLAGLMAEYEIDPSHYLEFVHSVDLDLHLQPDESLQSILGRIRSRKAIFTNASREYALRVLQRLGIASKFDAIIAIEDLGLVNKPESAAYQVALKSMGSPPPSRCLMIDDRLTNLLPAAQLGMATVLVGKAFDGTGFTPDYRIESIYDLLDTLPVLARPPGSDGHAGA